MPILASQGSSIAHRKAAITRTISGISSPDPATRLATFEDAMAGSDANLKRVAMSAAFSSSDAVLRSAALRAWIHTTVSFVVRITATDPREQQFYTSSSSDPVAAGFVVAIRPGVKGTDTFLAHTDYSKLIWNGDVLQRYGDVSGDRLSFSVNMEMMPSNFNNTRETFNVTQCNSVATLQNTGATLSGTMTCTYTARGYCGFDGCSKRALNYGISIDALQ